MKTIKNRKRVVNTAAIGLSLLMSSTLLVGNAVSVYASPTISTTEQNAIDAFLTTQPVDGDTRNIGATNPTVTPSTYTFPGINNYVSVFRNPSGDMRLTQDRVYSCVVWEPSGAHTYINVKIKDWSTIDWYKIKNTPEYEHFFTTVGIPIHELYFAKKITVIKQSDNSEMTLYYPVLVDNGNGYYSLSTHWQPDGANANIPIEADDPRFIIEYLEPESATQYIYRGSGGYWTMTSLVDNKYSYDTIVEIDESLKTNETVVSGGTFGERSATFEHRVFAVNEANADTLYSQYTSDVIYNMMKTDLGTATADGDVITNSYGWGSYTGTVHVTPSVNRVIRVGIDYTHYVADDGTVLKPTTYGLNPVDTIAGYQFVSSHREANGDLVHVYTVPTAPVTPSVPTTPSTLSSPSTPTSPSTPSTPTSPSTPSTPATVSASPRTMDKASIFGFSAMFLVGIFASIGVFFTRNKRA